MALRWRIDISRYGMGDVVEIRNSLIRQGNKIMFMRQTTYNKLYYG
jgi:hypothetical protein